MCDALEVSPAGYYAWREPARQRPAAAARRPARGDPGHPRRGQGPLRQPAHPRRAGGPRARLLRQHRGQAHARQRHRGQDGAEVPLHHRLQPRPAGGREPPGPAVRPRRGRTRPGWRTSPTSRPARAGCTWRPSRTCTRGGWSAGRWPSTMDSRLVVDALEMAVQRRLPGRGAAGALGPGQPVRQRALPTPAGQARDHVQHEPAWRTAGTTRRWRASSPR